ncbi:hypothetical protein [Bacillus phage CM1]|nr:hypothetical protein [Bacillus phage CM1]
MLYEIEHDGYIVVVSPNPKYALEKLFNDTMVLFDIDDKLPKLQKMNVGETFVLASGTYVTTYEQDMMGGKLV